MCSIEWVGMMDYLSVVATCADQGWLKNTINRHEKFAENNNSIIVE